MPATRQIGRYEVIGELGRGGMAVVHLARAPDGTKVAVKELAGFHNGDEAAAQRFLREAVVGSSLSHPNIVGVIERLEHNGTPFIVMEWVDGGTLRPFVGELSLPQLGGALEGLLGALAHAGRAGIVHRDLKPENVMLTSAGVVKVADFGIAKAQSVVEGLDGRLTRTGTAVGTPGYMAPEQAMGSDVSPATDLYATGCIAFETLTGRVPFAGQAPMVMLMSHANSDVPDLRTIDPLIAPPIADWVAKMTARDPDERFRDGDEAWAALSSALETAVGPDWRQSAAIRPEPPEVMPASSGPPEADGDPGAGTTGAFRTFAAPIALHEQLAAELGERPVIGAAGASVKVPTPAPQRVTRDALEQAVRQQTPTPAPRPAAPGKPSTGEDRIGRPGRGRAIAIGAGGVVLIGVIVGIVAASGGGGSSRPGGPVLSSAGVTMRVPRGWQATRLPAVAGVSTTGAFSPSGSSPGEGIGLASSPLSPGLIGAAERALSGQVKSVAVGDARGVEIPASSSTHGAALVLVPLSSGQVATLVCRGSTARSSCSSVAGTAAGALAAAPSSLDQQSARGALALQAPLIASTGRSLLSARNGNVQAAAAGELGRAFTAQQGALRAANVGSAAHVAVLLLADALGNLGGAWSAYGHAITSKGNTQAAAAAVRTARSQLGSAGSAAAALGLSLGSSLVSGPAPPRALALASTPTGGSSSSGGAGSASSPSSGGSTASPSSGGASSSSGSGGSGGSSSPASPSPSSGGASSPSSGGSSSSGGSPSGGGSSSGGSSSGGGSHSSGGSSGSKSGGGRKGGGGGTL